jgi:hypothetical protein
MAKNNKMSASSVDKKGRKLKTTAKNPTNNKRTFMLVVESTTVVDSQQEEEDTCGNGRPKRRSKLAVGKETTTKCDEQQQGSESKVVRRPRFTNIYEIASYCGMYDNPTVLQLFHFPPERPKYWREYLNKIRVKFLTMTRDEFELATRHLGREPHKNSLGVLLTQKLISIIMPFLVQNTLYNVSRVPHYDPRIIKFTLVLMQKIIKDMINTATPEERLGLKCFVVFDKSACSTLLQKLNVTLSSYIFERPRPSKSNKPNKNREEVFLMQTQMALAEPSRYPPYGYSQAQVLLSKEKLTNKPSDEKIPLLIRFKHLICRFY